MAKFNFWDIRNYFGKNPRKFRKEAKEQIETSTLTEVRGKGRGKWVSVEEIWENNLKHTDIFSTDEGKMFFAIPGIKAKINSMARCLKLKGHPIVSGKGKKGYRYADEKCDDFIYVWDEVLSGREERKTRVEKEYDLYEKLIGKICKRLIAEGKLKEAQELKQILVKYQR